MSNRLGYKAQINGSPKLPHTSHLHTSKEDMEEKRVRLLEPSNTHPGLPSLFSRRLLRSPRGRCCYVNIHIKVQIDSR